MADYTPEAAPTPGKWFAARRYGYGAGLPITWQGWVSLAVFLGVIFGVTFGLRFLYPHRPLLALFVVNGINAVAVALFLWVCKARTEGGWRWRWGEKD